MRQKSIFILLAVFISSLVSQNQSSFQAVQSLNNTQSTAVVSPVTVRVVSAAVAATVTLANNSQQPATSLACPNSANGALDLNEPANCFSLQLARQTAAFPKVVVVSSPYLAKVLVIQTHQLLTSPNLYHASSPSQIPVLPLTVFSLYVAYELAERKILSKMGKLSKQVASLIPNLGQLQVLRC